MSEKELDIIVTGNTVETNGPLAPAGCSQIGASEAQATSLKVTAESLGDDEEQAAEETLEAEAPEDTQEAPEAPKETSEAAVVLEETQEVNETQRDEEQVAQAPKKGAASWFASNKKAMAAGIAAALIVCAGMGACVWNQKMSTPNYAVFSKAGIVASAGQIHRCCIEIQAAEEPLYVVYDLSSQSIESIVLHQSAPHAKMNLAMFYRVYVSGLGWMGWAEEGSLAGSANLDRTIEKLEVVFIPAAHLAEIYETGLEIEDLIDAGLADASLAEDFDDAALADADLAENLVAAIVCPHIVQAYRDVPFTQTVPELLQYPELPYGCESVAATIALQSYGFNIQKTDLASSYLTYSNSDYINSFAGNPFYAWGMGRCMPPAIVNAVNKYLADAESPLKAEDITGISFEELCALVDDGYPVIVWTTQYEYAPVVLEKNGKYVNYLHEHALVMYGYDTETNTVKVSDPQLGLRERNLEAFARYFNITGNMAIVMR